MGVRRGTIYVRCGQAEEREQNARAQVICGISTDTERALDALLTRYKSAILSVQRHSSESTVQALRLAAGAAQRQVRSHANTATA